ncbi:unnamed protein product [Acanthoscelides obtectus]|uniref:Chitin-binding type-2 domain-containing protein n=1 Tax=Acanthoscelides obtectus TaxID=200917 RepID=A0A9P0KPY6_ACAOB|nr:unnamed protein product [Acanthoscelides obtectus]CAK1667747.1 hypothetical protein AOBTE_LOCUS26018 [Acanthoscelides obtectus]
MQCPMEIITELKHPDCKQLGIGRHPSSKPGTYIKCSKFGNSYKSVAHKCPHNAIFDGQLKTCVKKAAKKEVPDCEKYGTGLYPAPKPNQYYKCLKNKNFYKAVLHNCREGKIYDKDEKNCVIVKPVDHKDHHHPECEKYGIGRYPGETRDTYYKCSKNGNKYMSARHNCPAGQTYDKDKKTCVGPVYLHNCRESGIGNYRAKKCNQYYHCTSIHRSPKLKTCFRGFIFDKEAMKCVKGTCEDG